MKPSLQNLCCRRFLLLGFLLSFTLQPAGAILVFNGSTVATYNHVTAAFGPQSYDVQGFLRVPQSISGCSYDASNSNVTSRIVLVERGNCTFFDKALLAQRAGAIGVVVGNNNPEDGLLRMGVQDGVDPNLVTIPALFVSYSVYNLLVQSLDKNPSLLLRLNEIGEVDPVDPEAVFRWKVLVILLLLFPAMWCIFGGLYMLRRWVLQRRDRVLRSHRSADIPLIVFRSHDDENPVPNGPHVHNDACAICLEDFHDQETIKALPCDHGFHEACINPWLNERSDKCPICKQSIFEHRSARKCNWNSFLDCICCARSADRANE